MNHKTVRWLTHRIRPYKNELRFRIQLPMKNQTKNEFRKKNLHCVMSKKYPKIHEE